LASSAPIAQHNNKNGEERVNDQVNTGKAKIDESMPSFCFFIRHRK